MRTVIFSITILMANFSMAMTNSKEEPVTVVTILDADGDTIRIKSDDEDYNKMPNVGGVIPRACDSSAETTRAKLKSVETKLELEFLAQYISGQKDRILTENQKLQISRIPDCKEYRPLLHAVATVLSKDGSTYQGYSVEAN